MLNARIKIRQKYTGKISLEYRDEIIADGFYDNRFQRGKLLQIWEKRFSHQFHKCFLIICPDIHEPTVHKEYKYFPYKN